MVRPYYEDSYLNTEYLGMLLDENNSDKSSGNTLFRVVKLQGKIKSPQYLNVLNHDTYQKERKHGVLTMINIIQGNNMKKGIVEFISLCLVVFICLGEIPIKVMAKESVTIKRDVVILVDCNKFAELPAMRDLARKFAKRLLDDSGSDCRISIGEITSSYYNPYHCALFDDFTADIDEVYNAIAYCLPPRQGAGSRYTSMDRVFKRMDEFLEKNVRVDAEKDVFLLISGESFDANASYYGVDAKYGKSKQDPNYMYYSRNVDVYDAYYATGTYNAAYKVYQEIEDKYNFYSLGFHNNHPATNGESYGWIPIFHKFTYDLQNSGYEEAVNPDEIDLEINEKVKLVRTPQQSEGKEPIVFVPGVMGSKLYDPDSYAQRWDPPAKTVAGQAIVPFWSMSDSMTMNKALTPLNWEMKNQVIASDREYGATNAYKDMIDYLCENFPDREVYFFAYDFRKSNEQNATALRIYLEKIKKPNKSSVDLICHSMGGLVASSYVKQYGMGGIDKIITVATPYEGAPKLINSVLNWDVIAKGYEITGGEDLLASLKDSVLGLAGMQKKVKATFPAIAQLAPTHDYAEQVKFSNKYFTETFVEIDTEELDKLHTTIFGSANYNDALKFHKDITVNGTNILATLDNTYFAVGVNQMTISSVKYNDGATLDFIECEELLFEGNGDGTVPYLSATMMNTIPKNSERYLEVNASHTGIVSNEKTLSWIKSILNNETSVVTSDIIEKSDYTVLKIEGNLGIKVEKDGEDLVYDEEEFVVNSSFGFLEMTGENDASKMVCLDSGDNYNIELSGIGEGGIASFRVQWFDSTGELIEERSYESISVKGSTKIITNADMNGEAVLNVDVYGDGSLIDENSAVIQ